MAFSGVLAELPMAGEWFQVIDKIRSLREEFRSAEYDHKETLNEIEQIMKVLSTRVALCYSRLADYECLSRRSSTSNPAMKRK